MEKSMFEESDKQKHMGACFALTIVLMAIFYGIGGEGPAMIAAPLITFGAGILLELRQRDKKYKDMDKEKWERMATRDLFANAIGIGAAIFTLFGVIIADEATALTFF